MSSLVKDFQRDIVQSSKSTTELLRTAKLISAKLGLNDISEWVNCELNGYEEGATIPPYRYLSGGELQVRNPVHGWLPVEKINKAFRVGQSVSELEELSKSRSIVISLSRNENYSLHGSGMNVSHWQQQIEFSPVQLKGLLSMVKDKLLDWSLELETRGIIGENMSFDEQERKSAQSQVFNIQHFAGVLGDVSHSSVQVYDYSSLYQTLKQQNVPQEERNKLENIMDKLKTAAPTQKKSLLEKGKAWVVKNQEILGASASIVRKALGIDVG
jgi:AbiTii